MEDRREDEASDTNQQQPRIERIEAFEQFATLAFWLDVRPHAAKDHRSMTEGTTQLNPAVLKPRVEPHGIVVPSALRAWCLLPYGASQRDCLRLGYRPPAAPWRVCHSPTDANGCTQCQTYEPLAIVVRLNERSMADGAGVHWPSRSKRSPARREPSRALGFVSKRLSC